MKCVISVSYSIDISGNPHGYFQGKRGLCQGDPISPYLFTIVTKILTMMLERNIEESGEFQFHAKCGSLKIVNLCFVDDLMIFSHGDAKSVYVIKKSLVKFTGVSGLAPSFPKSTAFFSNVNNMVKKRHFTDYSFVWRFSTG